MNFKIFLLNLWVKTYYSLTAFLFECKISPQEDLNREGMLVVSFTTKPSRIYKTWLVVESLLRQSEKPDALILYLAMDEFKDESVLPARLVNLKKRGLQIVFVDENLKPHNKYYFAMKSFPLATIITVDDDKIYPSNLIKNLKEYHAKYPKSVCAPMTRSIKVCEGKIAPYIQWDKYLNDSKPSHSLISLGVGGVLYPSKALHPEAFNIHALKEIALHADDLWIKIMALKNNTSVASLAGNFNESYISIRGTHKEQLTTLNISQGENDIVFQKLISYYHINPETMLDVVA